MHAGGSLPPITSAGLLIRTSPLSCVGANTSNYSLWDGGVHISRERLISEKNGMYRSIKSLKPSLCGYKPQ